MTTASPNVYTAINAVQDELAKIGIAKDGVNEQQKYKFRGIDQVYSALSPLLAKHGLCVLPRVLSYDRTERTTMKPGYQGGPAKESTTFYVTVEAEFDFVAVADGSKHTIRTIGEAMDNGDKATNKAMSAAYKYAAFMAFAIPTEGDNDADATTHEVAPRKHTSMENGKTATRSKLTGPHATVADLKAACASIKEVCETASDKDSLDTYLDTQRATIIQVKADKPDWWTHPDYGLDGIIKAGYERIELELDEDHVRQASNLRLAG